MRATLGNPSSTGGRTLSPLPHPMRSASGTDVRIAVTIESANREVERIERLVGVGVAAASRTSRARCEERTDARLVVPDRGATRLTIRGVPASSTDVAEGRISGSRAAGT
jgi:hypothetical protein